MNQSQIDAINLNMELILSNINRELTEICKVFEGRANDSYSASELARLRGIRYKQIAAAEMILSCLYELRDGLGLSDNPDMVAEIAECQAGIEEKKIELKAFIKYYDE